MMCLPIVVWGSTIDSINSRPTFYKLYLKLSYCNGWQYWCSIVSTAMNPHESQQPLTTPKSHSSAILTTRNNFDNLSGGLVQVEGRGQPGYMCADAGWSGTTGLYEMVAVFSERVTSANRRGPGLRVGFG